jgi:hypothetical protein
VETITLLFHLDEFVVIRVRSSEQQKKKISEGEI